MRATFTAASLISCALAASAYGQPCGGDQIMAIPSYFYPAGADLSLWDRMDAAFPTVGIAIINPAIYNLPYPRTGYDDANYRAQTAASQGAGLTILGYVPTTYGARAMFLVKDDIDIFYDLFGVDGIFIDEVASDCTLLPYYQEVHDYVKAKGGPAVVVLNPGGQTQECFMSASDIVLTFDG